MIQFKSINLVWFLGVLLFIISCNNTGNRPLMAVLFEPGNISTAENHESIDFISNDGNWIIFTRASKDFAISSLYSSVKKDGKWSYPETLPFSGSYYDAGFTFSPDMSKAFFTSRMPSNHPDLSTEWNIWSVSYENGSWGNPQILSPPLNSSRQECCMTMNKNGQTFYSSNRDGSWDIYRAKYSEAGFAGINRLDNHVNSDESEWPGYINNDGDVMLFSSIRPLGIGGDDIYAAFPENGSWLPLFQLDSTVNSISYEDNPLVSNSGRQFFFSSWKDTPFSHEVSNIYLIESKNVLDRLLNNKIGN